MPELIQPTVTDASATEAELNAKIDAELGLPPQEEVVEDVPDDKPADDAGDSDTSDKPDDADTPAGGDADEEDVPGDKPKPEPAKPSDEAQFIEVEDSAGVTHKISKLEDLPEDFEYKNSRQPLEIYKQLEKLERDATEAAEIKRTQEEEAAVNQSKQEQFDAWDKEVTELAKSKRVDVKDTERIDAVFKHMNEINAARAKAKNPNLLTSFEDALDKFEAKEAADKAEQDKKNDNELAKKKSSLIGRSSAAAGGEHYVYKAGSARTIDDVPLD